MQGNELKDLIIKIIERKSETSKIEFKSAKGGAPEKLYYSLSNFSNTECVIIIFGIDKKHPSYFTNNYIKPLFEKGILKYTIPEKPKSKNQQIVIAN